MPSTFKGWPDHSFLPCAMGWLGHLHLASLRVAWPPQEALFGHRWISINSRLRRDPTARMLRGGKSRSVGRWTRSGTKVLWNPSTRMLTSIWFSTITPRRNCWIWRRRKLSGSTKALRRNWSGCDGFFRFEGCSSVDHPFDRGGGSPPPNWPDGVASHPPNGQGRVRPPPKILILFLFGKNVNF